MDDLTQSEPGQKEAEARRLTAEGAALAQAGQLSSALALFQDAAALWPDASTFANLARVCIALADHDRLHRQHWLLQAAALYVDAGFGDRAEAPLAALIQEGAPADTLILAAQIARRRGDPAQAIAAYRCACETLAPGDAHRQLAELLASHGDGHAAIATWQAVCATSSATAQDWIALGRALWTANDLDAAEEALRRGVAMDATADDAWAMLAALAERRRDYVTVEQCWRTAIAISDRPDYYAGLKRHAAPYPALRGGACCADCRSRARSGERAGPHAIGLSAADPGRLSSWLRRI